MADVVCHVTEQTNVNKVDLEVRSSIFSYTIFAPATNYNVTVDTVEGRKIVYSNDFIPL